MATPLCLVVPCYNEAARLDVAAYRAWLAAAPPAHALLFVDDGSTDDTAAVLAALVAAAPSRCRVLSLRPNHGKAEAVRAGLGAASEAVGADGVVGYWDADLATPLCELPAFLEALSGAHGTCEMVFGARVALLGRHIRRKLARHYLGRVFATLAANILGIPIYDTQCGAKLFRATPDLAAALSTPFQSRWAFDVELIARFVVLKRRRPPAQRAEALIHELPLRRWADVPGSKLRALSTLRMGLELLRIAATYFVRQDWPPQRAADAPAAATQQPRARSRAASPRARRR